MKYFIKTFGCQMNKSDSERIASLLEDLNYKKADNIKDASLVILNTCSVRASAESRALGLIRNLKRENKKIKIGITGCMIHIRPDKLKSAGGNFLFDIKDLSKLPSLLSTTHYKLRTTNYFKINPNHESKFHAFIPIMTGCNNFCTYCVVPFARNREKSRPSKEILMEVRGLIKKGYKAITLLGQNVNSYGLDLKSEIKFPELLKKISEIEGNFWIWFVTSHPKDMSDDLIRVIASSDKICNYIHLPVQAGSNKILKSMNRNYTKEKYLKLVKNIRNNIKDMSLSTDIIVGFPGETKSDFQDTIEVFKKANFDMAYIARYSPRPRTAAFNLKDDISNLEKKKRDKLLVNLLEKNAQNYNKNLIGKYLDVLIEKKSKDKLIGKTKTFKTVKITIPNKYKLQTKGLIGQIIKITIKKANNFGLEGIVKSF